MTKFILHGGFTSAQNEWNRSFYEEISKDVPNDGVVLLVYFSRKDEEVSRLFGEDKERILEQAGSKKLNIILATEKDFPEQVEQANAIYMRGGDTDKLLSELKKFPNFQNLITNKTVAGSSAGAYAIGKYGANHSVEFIREGLGLVPLRVICHYESLELPPNKNSVSKLKETASNLELVLLRDHEWKKFEV